MAIQRVPFVEDVGAVARWSRNHGGGPRSPVVVGFNAITDSLSESLDEPTEQTAVQIDPENRSPICECTKNF